MNAFLEVNKIYIFLILNKNTYDIYYKSALLYRYLKFKKINYDDDYILNNSIDILEKLHLKYETNYKDEYDNNKHNFNIKNITIDDSINVLEQVKKLNILSI